MVVNMQALEVELRRSGDGTRSLPQMKIYLQGHVVGCPAFVLATHIPLSTNRTRPATELIPVVSGCSCRALH